jgi:hypothetical protein
MGFNGFQNTPVGAQGTITRPAFKSDNYVPGSQGWAIFKNGNAEFNALGGSFQITGQGIFFYVPTAGSGNLFASFANVGGTDPYGNAYNGGFFINQHQGWFTGDNSHTVIVNANGASGPQLLFTVAGHASMAEIIGDQSGVNNRLLIQATGGSGSELELNMPVSATGGYLGGGSSPVSQPPFNVTGSMVLYASGVWAPVTLLCPPSETIEINLLVAGFNNASTTSTLSLAVQVKQGATVLMSPNQYGNGVVITPEGSAAASTNMHQKFRQYILGQDVLAGQAGKLLTVTPAWQISSGSAATASIDNTAHFSVSPRIYTTFQSG